MKYKFLSIPIILTFFLLQGCTVMLWRNVFVSTMEKPGIAGIVIDKDTSSGTLKYLMVGYSSPKNSEWKYPFSIYYYYAVPIDNGTILQLMAYSGPERTIHGILNDMPQDRLASIAQYKFSKESYRLGESLVWGERYKSCNMVGTAISTSLYGGMEIDGADITMIPYWRGDERIAPFNEPSSKWDKDKPLDHRIEILFLPSKQKRFASERTKTIIVVILDTPLALICDAISIPISIVTKLF